MSVEKMDVEGSINDLDNMYKDYQKQVINYEFNDVHHNLKLELILLKNKNRDLSKKRNHYLMQMDHFGVHRQTINMISEKIGKNSYRLIEIRSELLAIKRHNLVFMDGAVYEH